MNEATAPIVETQTSSDLRFRVANPFLSAVMRKLRSGEKLEVGQKQNSEPTGMYTIPGQYDGRPYDWPLVYFETGGCSFDKAGACTMCNFGRGTTFTEEQVASSLTKRLGGLKDKPAIVITPSGSLFDNKEVSPELRKQIYRVLKENGTKYFATESRPEFITPEAIREMRGILGNDVRIEVGLGLETINPDVSRYSINKMLDSVVYQKAVDTLHAANIEVYAHVLLKPLFLSEKEAYEDALKTIKWAFARDGGRSDSVGLGLMNLKRYTLTYWFSERGMYKTPSYRTVVKLLQNLPEEMRNKMSFFGFTSGTKIEEETGGCAECRDKLKNYIFEFVKTKDPKILDKAANHPCSSCKESWEHEMSQKTTPFTESLTGKYEFVAQGVFGSSYLEQKQNRQVFSRSLPV